MRESSWADHCRQRGPAPERLDIDVIEDAQTVTETVTALDDDPDNSDGCASKNKVQLASPVGIRRLINGVTGDEVDVEGRQVS